jgi:hypothetical protein
MNVKLAILIIIIGVFLTACNGDVGLLYANDCTAISKSRFANSIFKNNGSDAVYNEEMVYKNDGSNKAPGSSFFDTVINQEHDILQAYAAINISGVFCVPDVNGTSTGIITYSFDDKPGDIHLLGTFNMSQCSFNKVDGDTYKFHALFVVHENPNPDQNARHFAQYVNNSGTVEFTCERK